MACVLLAANLAAQRVPQATGIKIVETTATTATVSGYDIYGYPMVEAITITAGSQVVGKKAFRYIKSVVLNAADATHAYSVDTADVFGLPLRSDNFGDIHVNSATSLTAVTAVTAATGYLPSDRTSPATTTTGGVLSEKYFDNLPVTRDYQSIATLSSAQSQIASAQISTAAAR